MSFKVAPLAGAWIEISKAYPDIKAEIVAPLAGAWIEMTIVMSLGRLFGGRSPRGSVD